MRTIVTDGSPESVTELTSALAAALDGGPAVGIGAGSTASACRARPDSGVVVQTSGSSGAAKRVVLSAGALRASAAATHERLGGPGRWLLALPVHHIAGVQVLVRALLAGHPPTPLDTRSGFRAERFAAVAATMPGERRYTSLVPTQLRRLLADRRATDVLRGFDAVLVGGAGVPPALVGAARDAGVRVVTTYGMSETAGGCVYDGRPLAGVRVRCDADGGIQLAGPVLASGYLDDPAATAAAFADGWFHTRDLGRWDGGRLTVLGRADDVITSGGESVHPAAVERVLAAQPGVRAACVVGLPDPEWGQLVAAAVVLAEEAEADPDAWSAAVRAELGAPSAPRRVRVVAELPLRGVGKPDRAAVAALLVRER